MKKFVRSPTENLEIPKKNSGAVSMFEEILQ